MLVLKFGGTSVGSTEAIQQAAAIVADLRAAGHDLLVVTSAMSGVTDLLLAAAHAAANGRSSDVLNMAAGIRARHVDTCRALLPATATATEPGLLARLGDLDRLLEAVGVVGEASPRALDAIASLGERLSVLLLSGAIRERGLASAAIDGTEVVRTDAAFQAAVPDLAATRDLASARLLPLCAEGVVPVVTGFIGGTAEGVVTTLGRGGSDYSAALIGAAVDADEVWIYTDVDGVLTADPRVVPEARSLDRLSYLEMSELAYFGAKVVHPKTLLPAIERGIPLRIRNTFNPAHPGSTVLAATNGGSHTLRGVTAIERQCLVTIEGSGMLGVPGIAARAFGAVAATGTSVPMISQSSSEQNICFVVPSTARDRVLAALTDAFDRELTRRDIERIWAEADVVVVTAVGDGLRRTPGVAGRILGAVGAAGINVTAIAMGSSECSLSLVVDAAHARDAVRAIHTLL